MVTWLIILLIVIFVLLIVIWATYNSLIRARNNVENAWAQIDVQLKKRYDLVPNLLETVKGYMKHEKAVFTEITQLRSQAMQAKDRGLAMKANDKLTKAIDGILNVAVENYPELKASQNFMMLQEELSGIENKIAYSRQYFNDSVLSYNNKIQTFPSNIFAKMFGFKEKDFLEIPETEKAVPKVAF
jgi:LemA protein